MPEPTKQTEESAIMKVIEDECAAYLAKDYDAWAKCWMHTDYVRRTGWVQLVGVIQDVGWQANSNLMKTAMADYPEPIIATIRRENVQIVARGDMAWANFDQIPDPSDDPLNPSGLHQQMALLEKHEGQWKIILINLLKPSVHDSENPLIQVSKSGRVIWMNDLAKSGLEMQTGLRISAGNLYANSASSDAALRDALAEADRLNNLYARSATHQIGSTLNSALPVLLDDDGNATMQICWIISDSSNIFVSFNDKKTMAQRLARAKSIYSLSTGQMRLAAQIIEGNDLGQAAEKLDISVNTARTHLQRMFDKVGVRSQPALVRVLLSVAAPAG